MASVRTQINERISAAVKIAEETDNVDELSRAITESFAACLVGVLGVIKALPELGIGYAAQMSMVNLAEDGLMETRQWLVNLERGKTDARENDE